MRRVVLTLGALAVLMGRAEAAPANTLKDLYASLDRCVTGTALEAGADVTLVFMLNRKGGLIGKPRVTHADWPKDADPRAGAAAIANAFRRLPAARHHRFARRRHCGTADLLSNEVWASGTKGLARLVARRAGVRDDKAEQNQRERLMRERRMQRHDIDQRHDPQHRLRQSRARDEDSAPRQRPARAQRASNACARAKATTA